MSPLETGPSSPAARSSPADGPRAACLTVEPEHAISSNEDHRSNLAPRPSFLAVLLRALSAWPT